MTPETTAPASPRPAFERRPLPARLCNLGRLGETLERRGMDGVVSYLRPNVLYPDRAFIFFHGLGLEHIDMAVPASHHDWTPEEGMVVSAHLQVPGDARHRSWLEEIFLVTRDGGDPFFTWGNDPIAGGASGTPRQARGLRY